VGGVDILRELAEQRPGRALHLYDLRSEEEY
jgi:hypothetical protein